MHANLSISMLEPGDILLCKGNTQGKTLGAKASFAIEETTGSPYTHAAIYLADQKILDARPIKGIQIRALEDLVTNYDYVAVIRQPEAWSHNRITMLHDFANELDKNRQGYNYKAFKDYLLINASKKRLKWTQYKEDHQANLTQKIEGYFSGQAQETEADPIRSYFCSELVAFIFRYVGIIGDGVHLIYDAQYLAPGDLVADNTFGFRVGYIATDASYKIPFDDPVIDWSHVSEIPPLPS